MSSNAKKAGQRWRCCLEASSRASSRASSVSLGVVGSLSTERSLMLFNHFEEVVPAMVSRDSTHTVGIVPVPVGVPIVVVVDSAVVVAPAVIVVPVVVVTTLLGHSGDGTTDHHHQHRQHPHNQLDTSHDATSFVSATPRGSLIATNWCTLA